MDPDIEIWNHSKNIVQNQETRPRHKNPYTWRAQVELATWLASSWFKLHAVDSIMFGRWDAGEGGGIHGASKTNIYRREHLGSTILVAKRAFGSLGIWRAVRTPSPNVDQLNTHVWNGFQRGL
jgi:hypothetical protein